MENNQSVISAEVEITGTLKSSGSITINGKLNGDLESGGDVTVGKSANVKGSLNVNSITIGGTINGNINAKDRIEMKSSARVNGDIKAKRLAVEDGVTFVGKSEVNPSGGPVASSAPAEQSKGTEAEKKDEKAGVFAKR